MTTVITSVCDRCKTVVEHAAGDAQHTWTQFWGRDTEGVTDLCDKCAEEFKTWLAGDSTDSAAPSTVSDADAGKDAPVDDANTAATNPSPGGPTPMRTTEPTDSPTDTPGDASPAA